MHANGVSADRPVLSRKAWLGTAVILWMTVVGYAPALRAGFLFDDFQYLHENMALRDMSGLVAIWTDLRAMPQYYPVTFSSFWLEYQLWGLAPAGYHAVNILLHAACALLVWRALWRLGVPGAWLAAAIFAVHPVHVESVAWVAERKNVLSGLFYLLGALAYFRFVGVGAESLGRKPRVSRALRSTSAVSPPGRGRQWGWYAVAAVLFALALMSKTVTCTLPAALLLVIWWKRGRLAWKDVWPILPLLAMSAAMAGVTVWAERHVSGAEAVGDTLTPFARLLLAGRVLVFYLAKLIWPVDLCFIYPRWTVDAGVWWQYLYPLGVLILFGALWLTRGRLGRGPLAAMLFYAGTSLPTLGFVNVAYFRLSYVADHFQYLANIGPIALSAAGLALLAAGNGVSRRPEEPAPRRLIESGQLVWELASAGLIGVLLVLTWRYSQVFRNPEQIWKHTLQANPTSTAALANLGGYYYEQGRTNEAMSCFEEALRLEPMHVEALIGKGNVLRDEGRVDEAFASFLKAVEANPRSPQAHNNLGNALIDLGQGDQGVEHLRRAIDLSPGFGLAYSNLGKALAMRGQLDDAIASFEKALELTPQLSHARRNLGIALIVKGRFEEGIHSLRRYLSGRESDIDALAVLADGYVGAGLPVQAAQTLDRAIEAALKSGQLDRAEHLRRQRERLPLGATSKSSSIRLAEPRP